VAISRRVRQRCDFSAVSVLQASSGDGLPLLAVCRQRLDDPVATPVHLTILEQLPMTAVGKLDKVALRALAAADTPL
jgi:fatty-acyl-CoA synthase